MLNTIQHNVAQTAIIKCSTQEGPFKIEHIKKLSKWQRCFQNMKVI